MIRLQRTGRTNQVYFRLVVQPKRTKLQGKAVEILGWWDSKFKNGKFKTERVEYWISKGAQISQTAKNILKKIKKESTEVAH